MFTGEIPREIENLWSLEKFYASDMSLDGTIPAFIFNISSLKELSLLNNSLSGNLITNLSLLFTFIVVYFRIIKQIIIKLRKLLNE